MKLKRKLLTRCFLHDKSRLIYVFTASESPNAFSKQAYADPIHYRAHVAFPAKPCLPGRDSFPCVKFPPGLASARHLRI